MADYVEPSEVAQERYITQYFRGIEDHERIAEGSWQGLENITCDEYPVAMARRPRLRAVWDGEAMAPGKPVTAAVIDDQVYIGSEIGGIIGAEKTVWTEPGLRQVAVMGRQIYTNTGYLMDAELNNVQKTAFEAEWHDAQIFLCDADSEEILYKTEKPLLPVEGTMWFDKDKGNLYRHDGSVWVKQNWMACVDVIPEEPKAGEFRWDAEEQKRYKYENGAWVEDSLPQDGAYRWDRLKKKVFQFILSTRAWAQMECSLTEPVWPENGDYYYDPANNGLYRYSASAGSWRAVTESYVKLMVTEGVDVSALKPGDAVRIIAAGEDSTYLIHHVDEDNDYITFRGLLNLTPTDDVIAAGETLSTDARVTRRMPVLDFICERDNRMWGCRYGENDEGEFVNEIYASALGDPMTWFKYEGTSADSWTASVGAPGAWTGIAECGEYLCFFKRDRIFLVSGSAPSSFRYTEFIDAGVQEGSEKSLVSLKGALIYKSDHGIMRLSPYSYPQVISTALGDDRWTDAVAGTDGRKYYISMTDENGRRMYIYDTLSGYWTAEDEPVENICVFANYRSELLAYGGNENDVTLYVEYDADAAQAAKPRRKDYETESAYAADLLLWNLKIVSSKAHAGMSIAALAEAYEGYTYAEIMALIDRWIGQDKLFLRKRGCWNTQCVYLTQPIDESRALAQGYEIDTTTMQPTATPLQAPELMPEDEIHWYAETGWLGLSLPDEKRMRVLQARVKAGTNTRLRVKIRYEDTAWTEIGNVNRGKAGTYRIAYTPARRNDVYKLLIEGSGPMVLYSITQVVEDGGDRNVY